MDFSTVTKELLEEAIKMHRCPGNVFNEGVHGRKARIAGTGIEGWEIIAAYKSLDEDYGRLQPALHCLSEPQMRNALAYYRLYPDEITHLIEQNEAWKPKHASEAFPFLAGSVV